MASEGDDREGRFRLLGDQPETGERDPLGFDVVAEDLAQLILASRASTPFTLGIEASWGMGKSTLMRRLRDRLREERDVETVEFNAWTADEERVLEGLVKTVLNQLDPNVMRKALRNDRLMSWARALGSVVAGWLKLGSVVDLLWDRVAVDPSARNRLHNLLWKSVDQWRRTNAGVPEGRTLCVFVDDLDRCAPIGVLGVFEAMKLYLDVPGLVFVVGYDQTIVSQLVLREKGYSDAIKGRDYIEKFIQTTYRIVPSGRDRSTALVTSLLDQSGTSSLFGEAELSLVIDRNDRNPRRIKRFINSFVLSYGLDETWRSFAPETLIRVHLVAMYFDDFAKLLERPSEQDPLEEFELYRAARQALARRDERHLDDVRAGFESMSLSCPDPGPDFHFEELLQRLDDHAPVEFVRVVKLPGFVSLAQSLHRAADWPQMRERLAEGALSLVAAEPPMADADSAEPERRFDGLRVLWVDDAFERNARLRERLSQHGAVVTAVGEPNDARELLGRFPSAFDVLISDIGRPFAEDAGLTALKQLRDDRFVVPPVIFFTARVTQSRVRRAADLGAAGITNDELELMRLLADVARSRKRGPRLLIDGESAWQFGRQVLRELAVEMPELEVVEAGDLEQGADVVLTVLGPTQVARALASSPSMAERLVRRGTPHVVVTVGKHAGIPQAFSDTVIVDLGETVEQTAVRDLLVPRLREAIARPRAHTERSA